MTKFRVLRYEVPIDEDWHEFHLAGSPLHVGMRTGRTHGNAVEFWALGALEEDIPRVHRYFRVYGTGWELRPDIKHVGTVFSENGAFVWHLFELVDGGTPQ